MSKKVLEFVKNHKKEIIISSLAIIGGTAIFVITKKKPEFMRKVVPNFQTREEELVKINSLNWNCGELTDLWKEGKVTNLIINEVKVEELGKLGNELVKLEGVTNDSTISAIVGVL